MLPLKITLLKKIESLYKVLFKQSAEKAGDNIKDKLFSQKTFQLKEEGMRKILSLGIILLFCITFTLLVCPAKAAEMDKGIVMISADDGYSSLYAYVYPIMKKYNLPFTAYIVTSYVGTAGYVSWPQIWEMYWNETEIGNHSDKHLDYTGRTYTTIYNDINNAKTKFISQGLVNVTSFAYPFGVKTSNVVKALKAIGLTSGRGAWDENDAFNFPVTFDQWWIESLSFRNFTKASTFLQMKPYIDETVSGKSVLSIVLHGASPGASGDYELPSEELEKTVAYLADLREKGLLEVETVTRAVTKLLHYKNLP